VYKKLSGLFIILLLFIFNYSYGIDNETEKIMPFVNNNTYCAACHKSAEVKEKLKDTTRACDIFCKKCHKNMSKHHPAGVKLKNDLPENITLSSGKKLACITCHDLKVPRYDSVSWKAESLFGSIFKSEKRYKTYYLIIRNNDGDLCRKCH